MLRIRLLLLACCTLFITKSYSQSQQQLSPSDFNNALDQQGIQLLDVRTSGEYQQGHLAHALWADWNNQSQFLDRVQYLDKKRPVYVYCLSGGRSSSAAKWMRENGFSSVYELKGGINAWKQADLPVEGVAPVKQISLDEYNSQVAKGLVLVDIGATWCPPCKKMEPVVESISKKWAGKLQILHVDGGTQTALMKTLNAETIPTFILYKDGKEKWRKQGIVEQSEFETALSSN